MKKWTLLALMMMPTLTLAETITINMYQATQTGDGRGDFVGTVKLDDSQDFGGMMIYPDINGIPAGEHGFHIHEHGSCAPAMKDGAEQPALTAGGHFDPEQTGQHLGPYLDGHLGDLPILVVNQEGVATHPMLAPRVTVEDVKGRALMIHAGGDNYSDMPQPLGGGGARIACGIIGARAELAN